MSGAELKVQMTGLGLPSIWLATRLGVYTRTVIRWYEADRIPAKAVAEIEAITRLTNAEMHLQLSYLNADGVLRTERANREGTDLPASWHRALTFRVLDYARSKGLPVEVAYA